MEYCKFNTAKFAYVIVCNNFSGRILPRQSKCKTCLNYELEKTNQQLKKLEKELIDNTLQVR
jgi:hypothetical protein